MSYQHLLSPVVSTSDKNPQIQIVVLIEIIGFSFINTCFLMQCNSINLGLILFENQLLNVSIANFNSKEKSLARDVSFFVSKNCCGSVFKLIKCSSIKKFIMFSLKVAEMVNFFCILLKTPDDYKFFKV